MSARPVAQRHARIATADMSRAPHLPHLHVRAWRSRRLVQPISINVSRARRRSLHPSWIAKERFARRLMLFNRQVVCRTKVLRSRTYDASSSTAAPSVSSSAELRTATARTSRSQRDATFSIWTATISSPHDALSSRRSRKGRAWSVVATRLFSFGSARAFIRAI